MRGICKVMLVGRLGADPELRTSRDGNTMWSSLAIATNRSRRDGDAWIEETDWHRVKVFGRDAERVHRFLRKGDPLALEGRLTYDHWQAQDGTKRRTPEIVADSVTFAVPRREPVERAPSAVATATATPAA